MNGTTTRRRRTRWSEVAVVGAVALLGIVSAATVALTVEGMVRLGLYPVDSPVVLAVPATWLIGALLAATALVWRHRRPTAVVVVLAALGLASLAIGGVLGVVGTALAIAVAALTDARGPRTGWWVAAALGAGLVLALWLLQQVGLVEMLLWTQTGPPDDGVAPIRQLAEPPFSVGRRSASALLLLAQLALGALAGAASRNRRLADLAEAAHHEELTRASERTRLAREMHDVVAHSVSVMVALADGADAAFEQAPGSAREAMRHVSTTGRTALLDMQRVLGVLDSDDGDARREPADVELGTVVERFRAAGVAVRADGLDTPLPDDAQMRLAVVRIVTEALTNVLRHAAGARSVEVRLRTSEGTVHIEVTDSGGDRPATTSGTGRGLLGITERATLLGGIATAGPHSGGGWQVRVELPLGARGGEDR